MRFVESKTTMKTRPQVESLRQHNEQQNIVIRMLWVTNPQSISLICLELGPSHTTIKCIMSKLLKLGLDFRPEISGFSISRPDFFPTRLPDPTKFPSRFFSLPDVPTFESVGSEDQPLKNKILTIGGNTWRGSSDQKNCLDF